MSDFLKICNWWLGYDHFASKSSASLLIFFEMPKYLEQNIKLVEENELPQNDKEIADEVNSFFKNTLVNLEKYFLQYVLSQVRLPKLQAKVF